MPCKVPSNSERNVGRAATGRESASTAKPWFWLDIQTRPSPEVDDRVIRAVVAELHFDCARAEREREQLMPQADSKQRDFAREQGARQIDGGAARGRIARPVRKQNAVGFLREHRLEADFVIENHGFATAAGEIAQDIALGRRNPKRRRGGAWAAANRNRRFFRSNRLASIRRAGRRATLRRRASRL